MWLMIEAMLLSLVMIDAAPRLTLGRSLHQDFGLGTSANLQLM